jgi:guanosine-3',5'-bis(diphosphate) 3'-pyrophosphohydrolase
MDRILPDGGKLLEAVAFAARAHRHHLRKDGQTPYVSHVFRVCLTVRHLFGVTDADVLAAAVLHDTIEDTTTDFDDLHAQFGQQVAEWVAALSKDKRKIDEEREEAYCQGLRDAVWQVRICKLADIHDNLMDSGHLRPEQRPRTLARTRRYLDALSAPWKEPPSPERRQAFERAMSIVQKLHAALAASGQDDAP